MIPRHQQPARTISVETAVPVLTLKPKLTPQLLKRAAKLSKEIDALRKQLAQILREAGE
jgi:hypothetical protein